MDVSQLTKILAEGLPDALIVIEGDDYHRLITITSDHFEGLSRLARQRQVNKLLFPFFEDGSLHAVTIKTFTKSETSHAKSS